MISGVCIGFVGLGGVDAIGGCMDEFWAEGASEESEGLEIGGSVGSVGAGMVWGVIRGILDGGEGESGFGLGERVKVGK